MTPTELLEEAKGRFVVLYHNDETALSRLLKQALRRFQDKAGVILQAKWEKGTDGSTLRPLPSNFLDVAVVNDALSNYVPASIDGEDLSISVDRRTAWPITVHYFANLQDWPMDKDLPNGCVSVVLDYLVALIEVPNTERARTANAAMNLQADLPGAQELRDRLSFIEQNMEDNQAMLPPVSVTI